MQLSFRTRFRFHDAGWLFFLPISATGFSQILHPLYNQGKGNISTYYLIINMQLLPPVIGSIFSYRSAPCGRTLLFLSEGLWPTELVVPSINHVWWIPLITRQNEEHPVFYIALIFRHIQDDRLNSLIIPSETSYRLLFPQTLTYFKGVSALNRFTFP